MWCTPGHPKQGTVDVMTLVTMISYMDRAILCIQEGKTALAWASWKGHKQTVDVLLSAGAKPDIQDQVSWCVHGNLWFN